MAIIQKQPYAVVYLENVVHKVVDVTVIYFLENQFLTVGEETLFWSQFYLQSLVISR
jgi:hypothetical protein